MTLYLSTSSYSTSVTDAAGDVRAHRECRIHAAIAGTKVFAQSKKMYQLGEGDTHTMALYFPSTSFSPVVVLQG
jgi:hypothetical protein